MEKNRIGELRRELGLTQKELGEKMGVGQTTVSAWETGKSEPDYKSIREMAQLFNVSPDYLFGFNNNKITRGFSDEEYSKLLKKWGKEKFERELEEDERREEIMEQTGHTEEELDEISEDGWRSEWEQSGLPIQFETYKTMQLMDELPKAEREIIFQMIDLVTKLKDIK